MILFLHDEGRGLFTRLAKTMADLCDGETVTRAELATRDLTDVSAIVAVWWRAAEPLLLRKDAKHVKLIVRVCDHRSWRLGQLWPNIVARSSAIFATSETLAAELRAAGYKEAFALPNGVDCDHFTPARNPGSNEQLTLAWVADGTVRVKRRDVAEEARHLLRPHGVHIEILNSAVSSVPYESMPQWYAKADAVLCTSESEGTPNPIMEGCACGLPFISTRVGVVPEIYEATKGGVLLPDNCTANDIVSAALRLKSRRSRLPDMGRANRQHMVDKWQWSIDALLPHLSGLPEQPAQPANTYRLPDDYQEPQPGQLRVLAVATQAPGWGGAATGWYELIKAMRAQGAWVVGMFIHPWGHKTTLDLGPDPDSIGGIIAATPPKGRAKIQVDGTFDIVVAKSHRAPVQIATSAPLVYVSSSIEAASMGEVHELDGRDLFPAGGNALQAIKAADAVICHSSLDRPHYDKLAPELATKVRPGFLPLADVTTGTHADAGRPYKDRAFDLCFIASQWSRSVKNPELLCAICEAYPDKRIAVAGLGFQSNNPKHEAIGLIDHEEIFRLLGHSKVLVIPSHYDSAPGVYAEAIACGCNVVVGPNVGNCEGHPKELMAKAAQPGAFKKCIDAALRKRKQQKYRTIDPASVACKFVDELRAIVAEAVPCE
jgi:hypothetical protein